VRHLEDPQIIRLMRINAFLVVSVATMILLVSCSENREKRPINLNTLNDGLKNSNDNLKKQNDSLYKLLQANLQVDKNVQTAIIWFTKAQYLQFRSKEIYSYIDAAISNIKSDSLPNNFDSLFINLDFYKGKILSIDPEIYKNIKDSAEIITQQFVYITNNMGQPLNLYFSKKSKEEKLLLLDQTKNNIQRIENKTFRLCDDKIN
jgi:hypothetical protein